MNHHYKDIRDRIEGAPLWWDERAVPRYCKFTPEETANIYATEAVLLRIECQNCEHPFDVCLSWSTMDSIHFPQLSLATLVKKKQIDYGDPPNACPPHCASGATMSSIPVRVLEFWRREKSIEWVRVPELEIAIDPEWAKERDW